ncbi:hypothetical protein GCM10010415_67260 [Streptomyces atrovirens]
MFEPVRSGFVGFAVEVGWPCRGRGEAVDHGQAAGGEQASGVCGSVTLGLASAVEYQQVVRTVLFDVPPVAVGDLDLVVFPEDLRSDAGPFRVPLDADQPGARSRAGGRPGRRRSLRPVRSLVGEGAGRAGHRGFAELGDP